MASAAHPALAGAASGQWSSIAVSAADWSTVAAESIDGQSILHLAAADSSVEALSVLSAITDAHGRTAVHIAAEVGNAGALKACAAASAAACAQADKMGRVPLHWACSLLNAELVHILLDSLAGDPALLEAACTARTSTSGETPLHWLSKAASGSSTLTDTAVDALLSAVAPALSTAAPGTQCRAGKLPAAVLTAPAGTPAHRLHEALQSAAETHANKASISAAGGSGMSAELAAAVAPIQRSAVGVSKARGRGGAKKKTLKVALKPRA